MKRFASTGALALATAACLAASSAHGQVSTNARTAQLLFDEARDLAKAGNFAAACPKFVESQRLDPAGGTVLHAADCHESEGKVATAWSEYNEALSFAVRDKRPDREKIARERIASLTPKLGKLTLVLDAPLRQTEGLTIEIDDSKIARAGWDAPMPLDKGNHVVVAWAPGYAPFRGEVVTEDGRGARFRIPALQASAQPARPVVAPAAPEAERGSGRRTLGLVVGGVGVAGLVVGTVFGVRAASIGDQSSACTLGPQANGCPQSAVDDQDAARSSGTIATIALIAGGALAAIGGVIYFTAPKGRSRTAGPSVGAGPSVANGGGGVFLSGRF